METHEGYTALLDAFLDGELSEEDAERVRAHLEDCGQCRAYLDDAMAIRAAFPQVEDTPVPDGFAEAVLAALPDRDPPEAPEKETVRRDGPRVVDFPAPARRDPWRGMVLPLAAALALILLIRGIGPRGGADSGGSVASESRSLPMEAAEGPVEAAEQAEEAGEEGAVTEDADGDAGTPPETPMTADADGASVDTAPAEARESADAPIPGIPGGDADTDGTAGARMARTERTADAGGGTMYASPQAPASEEARDPASPEAMEARSRTTASAEDEAVPAPSAGTSPDLSASNGSEQSGSARSGSGQSVAGDVPAEDAADDDPSPILLVLPPEAAPLLGDRAPYAEADGGQWWSLTEEQYGSLIRALRDAGVQPSDRIPSMIPEMPEIPDAPVGAGSVYVLVWDE